MSPNKLFSTPINGIILESGKILAREIGIAGQQVDVGGGRSVDAEIFCSSQIEGSLLAVSKLSEDNRVVIAKWIMGDQ